MFKFWNVQMTWKGKVAITVDFQVLTKFYSLFNFSYLLLGISKNMKKEQLCLINKKKVSIFVQIGEEATNNLRGDSSLWWFVIELIRTFEITGRARKKLCEKQQRKIHGGAFHYIYRNGHFHRSSDRWKGKRIAHLRQMFLTLRGRILSFFFDKV